MGADRPHLISTMGGKDFAELRELILQARAAATCPELDLPGYDALGSTVPISTWRSVFRQPIRLAAPPRTVVIRAGLRNWPPCDDERVRRRLARTAYREGTQCADSGP
jgi:hypothetical protein